MQLIIVMAISFALLGGIHVEGTKVHYTHQGREHVFILVTVVIGSAVRNNLRERRAPYGNN